MKHVVDAAAGSSHRIHVENICLLEFDLVRQIFQVFRISGRKIIHAPYAVSPGDKSLRAIVDPINPAMPVTRYLAALSFIISKLANFLGLSRLVVSGVRKKDVAAIRGSLFFKAKNKSPLLGDSAATSALGHQSTNYPMMPTSDCHEIGTGLARSEVGLNEGVH